jgi:hypothetical protein
MPNELVHSEQTSPSGSHNGAVEINCNSNKKRRKTILNKDLIP